MMRLAEPLVFLSLAAGLHVGLWSVAPRMQGTAASDGPTQATVTLVAAPPQQAALARTWQAEPQAAQDTVQPALPAEIAPPPDRPRNADRAPPALTAPRAPSPVLPVAPPEIDTSRPRRQVTAALSAPARPQTAPVPDSPTMPSRMQTASPPPRPAPLRAPPVAAERLAEADTAPPPPAAPATRPRARPRPPDPGSAAKPDGAAAATAQSRPSRPAAAPGGSDRAASANTASHSGVQAKWGARIQRKVHRQLFYPRGASGSGTARVALTVDRTGRLTGLRLTRSSGVAAFDSAALDAVRRAGRFPAAPDALTGASYTFTLSLAFRP